MNIIYTIFKKNYYLMSDDIIIFIKSLFDDLTVLTFLQN